MKAEILERDAIQHHHSVLQKVSCFLYWMLFRRGCMRPHPGHANYFTHFCKVQPHRSTFQLGSCPRSSWKSHSLKDFTWCCADVRDLPSCASIAALVDLSRLTLLYCSVPGAAAFSEVRGSNSSISVQARSWFLTVAIVCAHDTTRTPGISQVHRLVSYAMLRTYSAFVCKIMWIWFLKLHAPPFRGTMLRTASTSTTLPATATHKSNARSSGRLINYLRAHCNCLVVYINFWNRAR